MSKPVKPKKQIVLNPISGQLEYVTGNNFSYESIPVNKKLKIRDNEQMLVHEEFVIDGNLELDGSLIVEE